MKKLVKDPFNLIIAGVGGQGNVTLAQLIADAIFRRGYSVIVNDTFGASQRGGSVVSHLRIAEEIDYCGPLIPKGQADFILGMEPLETLRAMGLYANPETKVLVNPRPIFPPTCISGEDTYPDVNHIITNIKRHCGKIWVVRASDEAIKIGTPLYANVILLGAAVGTGVLPVNRGDFAKIFREKFADTLIYAANMRALDIGIKLIHTASLR